MIERFNLITSDDLILGVGFDHIFVVLIVVHLLTLLSVDSIESIGYELITLLFVFVIEIHLPKSLDSQTV